MTKSKHLNENEYLDFMKKFGTKQTKEITGTEKENILKMLDMLEPNNVWNNQKTYTEEYSYQGNKYEIHYEIEETPILYLITN